LLAWTHQSMFAALNSWTAYMDEMDRQRELMFKAANMWNKQLIVRAFNQWVDELQQAHLRHDAMYRAMYRWATRTLSQAFNAWQGKLDYENEESVMIAMQHYKFSSLSAYLAYWRVLTQVTLLRDANDSSNKLKADAHRDNVLLLRAFQAWDDHVNDVRVEAPAVPEPVATPPPPEPVDTGPTSRIARAVDPYGLFSCIVGRTTYGKQDRALYYVVAVTLEGRTSYDLNKRYRDFDLLHTVVMERFGAILQSIPDGPPALPPKKSFTKVNPEFYENRALELHSFLQKLIAVPEVAASEELCEFLQFHTYL